MAKYINPFCDMGFKRIFGQEMSKPLIIDFLNSLLKGEKEIVSLEFLDKEQPSVCDQDRSLIYDIYCKTSDGERIIVEMQNKSQPYFKKRSIYYVSEAIARQGERGPEWKYGIRSVYFVAFLNYRQRDIGDEFRTDVALMDMKSRELFSSDIRMIYLQLPYFTKQACDCETNFDKWIYALKNMEELMTRLPWVTPGSIFAKLAEITDISSMSKEDRLRYDESIKKFRDTICVMEGAKLEGRSEGFAEGEAKGRARGRAEGRAEERMETARKLKQLGVGIDVIKRATGLSKEEIEKL